MKTQARGVPAVHGRRVLPCSIAALLVPSVLLLLPFPLTGTAQTVSSAATEPTSRPPAKTPAQGDTIGPFELDPLVVTATKTASRERDLAVSVTVVENISPSPLPATELLDRVEHEVPSLHVTRWGVMGFGVAGTAAGKLSIRGVGGSSDTNVLILRDGRPDFMGLMGCTIADELTGGGVERVEVIRGPASFLYGTNATGGVINIIPKTVRADGYVARVSAALGGFDSRRLTLESGGKSGRFDYYLSVGDQRTDGHRPWSSYRGDHYSAHMGYELSPSAGLTLNANLADIREFDPGTVDAPAQDHWYDITRWGGDVTLSRTGGAGDSSLKLHGTFGRHSFFDGWRSNDRILGAMLTHTVRPWSQGVVTGGFDLKRYGGEANDASGDYGSHFVTERGAYVHVQQGVGERFVLSGGLRAEDSSQFGGELLPMGGLVVHAFSGTSVRVSAARGFRSPSLRELYFWAPANASLTPDRYVNIEAGVQQHIGGRARVEAVVFRVEGSNLVEFSGPPPRWVNTGSYAHDGWELTGRWKVSSRFQADASWSRLFAGRPTYNSPEWKVSGTAAYTLPWTTLSARWSAVGGLTGADFSASSANPALRPLPDYAVLDATARFRTVRGLALTVTVNNVTNADYQTMYGYPMPHRYLMVELGHEF